MNAEDITIVIVDDDPGQLELLRIKAETEGFKHFEASSAEEGIALIEEHNPQRVIMDGLDLKEGGVGGDELKKLFYKSIKDPSREVWVFTGRQQSEVQTVLGSEGYNYRPKGTSANPMLHH